MSESEEGDERHHLDADQNQGPRRKRKRRAHLNCSECRRLKLKCDRKVPCENCVKRSCQDLCPDRSRSPVRGPSSNQPRHTSTNGLDVSPHHHANGQSPFQRGEQHGTLTSSSSPSHAIGFPIHQHPSTSAPHYQIQPEVDALTTSRFWSDLPRQPNQSTFIGTSIPHQGAVKHMSPRVGADDSSAGAAPAVPDFSNRMNGSYSDTSRPSPRQYGITTPNAILPGAAIYPQTVPPPGAELSNLSPSEQSHGTLVISHSGRSKYLGPSAASEWLKDQEVIESASRTPAVSRAPSPRQSSQIHQQQGSSFPFGGSTQRHSSTAALLNGLPARDEADALIDSYHRYFGWSYDIVPKPYMLGIVDETYSALSGTASGPGHKRVNLQKVALLYIVLAMGALHNLELAPDDPVADEYLSCAKNALASDDFMINNTIAGVQTLVVMAHFHLETDKGRDGDSAWPLWGLAMRIIQAMGIHRDGERWHLPPNIIEERRRLFWESHSAEIFQANCFSRPCSIPSEFVDTKFPNDPLPSYHTLRCELSKIAKDVLYCALTVQAPAYESFVQLYERLCAFEKAVPYPLRCRTALIALPSLYSDPRMAEADSPETSKRDLRRTFEQHSLALMIAEAIVNLYRPYFMRALTEFPQDPFRSSFGQPFLLVVERSNVIIQIVCSLYGMHPSVTARHWWCWYHAFNAAVCLGTLILMSPHIDLAPVALGSIEQVIAIYTSIVQTRSSPRFVQNLRWLLRLRQRAVDRINQPRASNQSTGMSCPATTGPNTNFSEDVSETDAALLGWRTRFIERAARGSQKATTISTVVPNTAGAIGDIEGVLRSIPLAVQEHVASEVQPSLQTGTAADSMQASSTDTLLHQFWDPLMTFQDTDMDSASALNWWDILNQVQDGQDGPLP